MLARNIHDEDTIELQLSPAELETLTRAAEAAEAAERAPPPTAALVSKAAPTVADTPAPTAAPEVACVPAAASTSAPAAESAPARSSTAAPTPERAPTVRALPPAPSSAGQSVAAPTHASAAPTHASAAPTHASAAPARASALWPVPATPAPAPRPPAPITVERAPPTVPIDLQPPTPTPTRNGLQFLSLQVAAAFTAAIAALVALFYYWPTPGVPAPATSPATSPTTITAPTHETAPLPPPEPPAVELTDNDPRPVRFANPFDSSEIFEFPPGTPYADARDEVARTLMARARERAAAPPSRKTTPTTRPELAETEASLARQL